MNLPEGFKQKTYFEIGFSELAKVSEKHFGGELDMAVVLDFPGQDSYRTASVPSDREWAIDWDSDNYEGDSPELIARIKEELAQGIDRTNRETPVSLEAILDLLHDDGVIPAGEYLITIWW